MTEIIYIFLLILIIAIIISSYTGGAANEENPKYPYTKLGYTYPKFINELYPLFCIDTKPHHGTYIPVYSQDKIDMFIANEFINDKRRIFIYHNRLYTEIYSAVAFLTNLGSIIKKKQVVIDSPHTIAEEIISKLFKIKTYKPAQAREGCIYINLNMFMPDIFTYISLYKSIYIEYEHIKHILTLKPKFSFHLCRAFNRDFNIEIPMGAMVLVPFANCSVSHTYGLIIKENYKLETHNLYNIWIRLVIFDLCVRNLNHGYHQYETWDTAYARKYAPVEPLLGPIPEIPLKNIRRHFATHMIINNYQYSYIKYSTLKYKEPQITPIINKVNDLYIFNIPLFDIGIDKIAKKNIGFYLEDEKKEYLLKYKYAGTIYTKYKSPKYIQCSSYIAAQKLAKKNKVHLMPENFELDILIDAIYKYICSVKNYFDNIYFENIYIIGEQYNAPVICALHKAYPMACICVLGDIEKIYTINYPYTGKNYIYSIALPASIVIF